VLWTQVRCAEVEQQIRFCTTSDGVRLAYAVHGSGSTIVRAATWLTHLDYDWESPVWRHWLEGLGEAHTVIRYDERGCGLSDREVDELSVDAWVADLETVVDAAGLDRFALLGVSQGAAIALVYAVRHPERLTHLADDLAAVINQTGLDRSVLVAWSYGGVIVADYIRAYGEQRIAGLNLVASAVMLKPPTFDHIGPGFLENAGGACAADLGANIDAIQRFLQACTARPLSSDDWSRALCWNMVVPAAVRGALISRELHTDDVLSNLSVPVLVTHGRSDTIVLPSMAEHVLDVCGTARPSWYDGVGHVPFWEDAARFDRELGELVGYSNYAPAAYAE
jgi:pimeloyl-ACP methyl ester carboxylesterase